MRLIEILKTTSVKLSFLALSFVMFCYLVHTNESLSTKAKRISFPGLTRIHLNRSMEYLNLEKVDTLPEANLVKNLAEHEIRITSSLFIDKKNDLVVALGENLKDQHLIFVIIHNNQVTQIQKINEITNKKITLQYGKISLNTQVAAITTNAATEAL